MSSPLGNVMVAYSLSIRPCRYMHTNSLPFFLSGTWNLSMLYPYLGVHHQVMSFLDFHAQAFEHGYGHLISLSNGLAHLKTLNLCLSRSVYLPPLLLLNISQSLAPQLDVLFVLLMNMRLPLSRRLVLLSSSLSLSLTKVKLLQIIAQTLPLSLEFTHHSLSSHAIPQGPLLQTGLMLSQPLQAYLPLWSSNVLLTIALKSLNYVMISDTAGLQQTLLP